jgi:hypothetical protein
MPIWTLTGKITLEGPQAQNWIPPSAGYGLDFFESPRGESSAAAPARFERTNCIQRDTGHMSQIPLRNTPPRIAQDFLQFTKRVTCTLKSMATWHLGGKPCGSRCRLTNCTH